jgi:predicted Zn-dependent protease
MRHWLAVGLVAAAACEGVVAPRRVNVYSYADTVAGQRVVFHWPGSYLPVRYYAYPDAPLPQLVRGGLARWEAQFLYGEFRAVLVADSAQADVIVAFEGAAPPPAEPDTVGAVAACEGVTAPIVAGTTLERPVRVSLRVLSGFTPGQVAACIERVTLHELGHTLGLFNANHAGADSTDLMNAFPRVYQPGPRDRATVEVLYHTQPTITPTPR